MVWALLMELCFGCVVAAQVIPEPIPYAECVELAAKRARYYDHTMAFNFPELSCEVVENEQD